MTPDRPPPWRMAFAGFRHTHLADLYSGADASPDLDIVACAEPDAAARAALAREGRIRVTHDDITRMLDAVDCDIVAVGDVYGRRGGIVIEALRRGKHVIADKPLCTRLPELDAIERLTADSGLALGCQLDMRDRGRFIRLRELARGGAIGEIHAISIGGQHPLLPDSRPGWYFEKDLHGGTINDIGIHAFDLIPWVTGLSVDRIVAARSWNALARRWPHMHDAGQFMLRMSNGCGVLGDVSYLMPGAMGYRMAPYWKITLWGSEGLLETSMNADHVLLATTADQSEHRIEPAADDRRGYLSAFLADIRGASRPGHLDTASVIAATRLSLTVQAEAQD